MAKILITDDDEVALECMLRILTAAGHDVVTAADGPSSVVMAASSKPSLILMDLCMPDFEDGLRAIEEIRTIPDIAKTFVVVLSARAFLDEQSAARDAGCDAVFEKPIKNIDAFLAKLEKWLLGDRS